MTVRSKPWTLLPETDLFRRREAEKGGGKFQIFFTLGQYDLVGVGEMPSDEAYLKLALWLGSLGNVRTKTLKAWPEADAAKVIAQLS